MTRQLKKRQNRQKSSGWTNLNGRDRPNQFIENVEIDTTDQQEKQDKIGKIDQN